MGETVKDRSKSACQRVRVLPSIPEVLAVAVVNMGFIDHAWKDDFDVSDTYEALLKGNPYIREKQGMLGNSAVDPDFKKPDAEIRQHMHGGKMKSVAFTLPTDMVATIANKATAENTSFSKTLVDLLLESPRVQVWARVGLRTNTDGALAPDVYD